jgi:hypothetical protein
MTDAQAIAFMAGVISVGFLIVGCFFLRFWIRTHDVLFLIFAAAFALLSLNQAIPVLFGIPREEQGGVYLLRAGAFALIIVGILMKNAGGRGER